MTFNKMPEFGARFQFPENIQLEYGGQSGCVASEIAVRMAEKYDDFVVEQIANEAREAGISDLTVLNKGAIIEAMRKQIPCRVFNYTCPRCGKIDILANHFAYCNKCGQALDWGADSSASSK